MILGVALETKVRICSRSRESYDDISDDLFGYFQSMCLRGFADERYLIQRKLLLRYYLLLVKLTLELRYPPKARTTAHHFHH